MTQNKSADTRYDRRQVIVMGAAGIVTLVGLGNTRAGALFAQSSVSGESTPALEEGPYWVDETGSTFYRSNVTASTDGTSPQAGLPLQLSLTVSQITNEVVTALPDAFVYLWHCNALGVYSDEASESTSGATWLRGYQVTDSTGTIKFSTIYPGWYSGRTTHIHLRIRIYPDNDPTQAPTYDFETQLFFDDSITETIYESFSPYSTRATKDTENDTDRVYSGASLDGDGVTSDAGALTTVNLAHDNTYVIASFGVVLNLSLKEPTGTSTGTGTGTGTGRGGGSSSGPSGRGGIGPGGGGSRLSGGSHP